MPHATIVGGEVRDAVADVRLTRGALEGTLTAAFANIDPGLAADRPPLAGAVSGSIDAAMATPSITTFSLPDTTGRVAADARAVARRRSDHRSRDAAGDARGRRPRRRVARRRRPARRRDGEGAGRAHPRRGVDAAVPRSRPPTWRRRRRSPASRTSPAPGTVEGTVTGNLAELHTTGTLALSNAAYGTTARAVDTQVRYDVTLPDLDAQRIRVDAQTRAALVEAAGQSLREVTADVRYADRAAAFSATVAASDARTARRRGHRGAAAASRRRRAPRSPDRDRRGHVVVAHRAGPDRLRRRSRRRRSPGPGQRRRRSIEAAGAVAVGDATARAVPADRPLRLTLTDVDLAAVDRLAQTGRDLGGIVNGTATASGDLARAARRPRTLTVRDGKVGDFTYQSLDASGRPRRPGGAGRGPARARRRVADASAARCRRRRCCATTRGATPRPSISTSSRAPST